MFFRKLKAFATRYNINFIKKDSFIKLINNKYGATYAAETLSTYIKNYSEFTKDQNLRDFFNFFIENWELSSSQWGQDIFVMYSTKSKENGKYLEIGGADGFTGSNTISLNRHKNWSGTLVEPDNEMYEILKNTRKKDKTINACVSIADSNEILILRKVGQLSSLVGFEGQDQHFDTRMRSRSFQKTKGISLNKILKDNHYDYFSLDVEGIELNILESVKWGEINKPFAITVEYNFKDEEKNKITDLLINEGYKIWFSNYEWLTKGDLWFTR